MIQIGGRCLQEDSDPNGEVSDTATQKTGGATTTTGKMPYTESLGDHLELINEQEAVLNNSDSDDY